MRRHFLWLSLLLASAPAVAQMAPAVLPVPAPAARMPPVLPGNPTVVSDQAAGASPADSVEAKPGPIEGQIEGDPSALKPGQFLWTPGLSPTGPMVMVVSIPEQRAYVYRNGLRIGVATVSTGKKGYETPTGVFTILQKKKDHRSNLYDDAPMPYMQRLTWDGIALHAGKIPGYPASHGCVRLPFDFSRLLYETADFGMTVVVADEASHPPEIAHPGVFAPVDPTSAGRSVIVPRLSWFQAYRWVPQKSPEGPVSILVSGADQRVLVLRNGVEIGRAKFGLVGKEPLGTHAYVLMEGTRDEASRVVPGRPALNWLALTVPTQSALPNAPEGLDPRLARRIVVPPGFAEAVYAALLPGASVVVTDAPVLSRTTSGQALTVLAAEEASRNPFEDEPADGAE
jgi:hypothetical protein